MPWQLRIDSSSRTSGSDSAGAADQVQASAPSDGLIAGVGATVPSALAVRFCSFTIPAARKAWVDQVTRIGHPLGDRDGLFHSLRRIRRAILLGAHGGEGFLSDRPFEHANFPKPGLRFPKALAGIGRVEVISHPATTAGRATVAANCAHARTRATAVFARP